MQPFTRDNSRIRAVALLPGARSASSPCASADRRRDRTRRGRGGLDRRQAQRPARLPAIRYYDPIYAEASGSTFHRDPCGGPGNRYEMFDRAIESRCVGHPTSLVIEMTSMMFGGVFGPFPNPALLVHGGRHSRGSCSYASEVHEATSSVGAVQPPRWLHADRALTDPTSGRIFFHCEADERIIPYAGFRPG